MLTEAIMVGMPPYDFWHSDPKLFFNYVDAYSRKQKAKYKIEKQKLEYDRDMMNNQAWLNGLYIDYALKVNPAMGKSKQYLREPIKLGNNNEKEEKKSTISEEEKRKFEEQLAIAQFEQFGKYTKVYNQVYHGGEDGE